MGIGLTSISGLQFPGEADRLAVMRAPRPWILLRIAPIVLLGVGAGRDPVYLDLEECPAPDNEHLDAAPVLPLLPRRSGSAPRSLPAREVLASPIRLLGPSLRGRYHPGLPSKGHFFGSKPIRAPSEGLRIGSKPTGRASEGGSGWSRQPAPGSGRQTGGGRDQDRLGRWPRLPLSANEGDPNAISQLGRQHAAGCSNLALMFANGRSVDKDEARAAALYTKACEGGYAEGCYSLGFAFAKGIGVRQNSARATELFAKACETGYAVGCVSAGFAFASGLGVNKDDMRSATFYTKACEGGSAAGCSNLGEMFERVGA